MSQRRPPVGRRGVPVHIDPTGLTGPAASDVGAALGPAGDQPVAPVRPRDEPQPLSVQLAQSDKAAPTGSDCWDDLISLLGIGDVPVRRERRCPRVAAAAAVTTNVTADAISVPEWPRFLGKQPSAAADEESPPYRRHERVEHESALVGWGGPQL